MPTSEKQIAANRRNAKKSTGPVTAEGIQWASRNATKHGLYSEDEVINCSVFKENREEYDKLSKNLMTEFAPQTPDQEQLVTTILNTLWRLRRFKKVNRMPGDDPVSILYSLIESDFGFKHTHIRGVANDKRLKQVRSTLEQQMLRTYKALRSLQTTEGTTKHAGCE